MRPETAVAYGLFLLIAAPASLFDVRKYRIPDYLTLGGILLLAGLRVGLGLSTVWMVALQGCVGYGAFWLIHRVSRGGMGLGDAKFSALIAVAVGLLQWLVAVLAATVAGLVFAAVMILVFRRDRHMRIPFAPFLTLGAIAAVAVAPLLPGL